ncbi:MAG: hypothetical protein JXX28_06140 [Deltaproteobacteria bacterium]|nr:hypothetical protein [Deltaproteobacteria bacterium]
MTLRALLALPLLLAACGDKTDTSAVEEAWTCDADHEDWERCSDGVIEWCHAEVTPPHFHAGADCAAAGYTCAELEPGAAACVDQGSACEAGEATCEEGVARTCVDGHFTVTPCGLSQECHVHDGHAECEDTGGLDDDSLCEAYQEGHRHEAGLATSLDEVFSSSSHAPLDELVEVHLPDQAEAFIHFPVAETGTYRVMFDAAGVFSGVLDAAGVDQGAVAGAAFEACPEQLPEVWTASLTAGDGTVPYVLRLGPAAAQDLVLTISLESTR